MTGGGAGGSLQQAGLLPQGRRCALGPAHPWWCRIRPPVGFVPVRPCRYPEGGQTRDKIAHFPRSALCKGAPPVMLEPSPTVTPVLPPHQAGLPARPAPLVPAAPVPVPEVRAGSHFDAKQLRARIQALVAGVERAGETLGALLEQARAKAIHLVLERPPALGGGYFQDFTELALCPAPHGLGLTEGLVEALVAESKDPARRARVMLASDVVVGRQGVRADRDAAGRPGRRLAAGERGAQYKLARLKRDHPDLLERLARGELPSLKAAWAAAGLQQPRTAVVLEPMCVARLIVCHFDEAGQAEILRLVAHPETITAPPGNPSPAWRAYAAARMTAEDLARQEAERAARRVATRAAIDARRREERRAARAAGQAA